jgi:hypothetical protein
LKPVKKNNNNSSSISAIFLVVGIIVLAYSMLFSVEIAAFVGLGLTFWGVIFSLARNGKYVESGLLDGEAKSAYSTYDKMIRDLKFNGQAFYIPAYPQDVQLPEYLKSLREPVVFISERFDGRPSADELAAGKFLSEKAPGVFITSPGSGIMAQMEKRLGSDFTKIEIHELIGLLPRCLTETFNLAKSVDMSFIEGAVSFRATGILYQSLYRADPPLKSVSVLGCPVVSAVASTLAKASGKTVIIKEQALSSSNCGVNATFNFV